MSHEVQAESPSGGYDPAFFDTLIGAEDHHFWFRYRNDVIEAVLASLVSQLPDGYRVLEFGCGAGNTLRALERACARGQIIAGWNPLVAMLLKVELPRLRAQKALPIGTSHLAIARAD